MRQRERSNKQKQDEAEYYSRPSPTSYRIEQAKSSQKSDEKTINRPPSRGKRWEQLYELV